jgi:hypothetical protein
MSELDLEIPHADDTLSLRRYFSHDKFVELLKSRTLYFAPASRFSDEREGHYTNADYQAWDNDLARWGFDEKGREIAASAKTGMARHSRQTVVISCWTKGVVEDIQMWREYGHGGDAVAIETTVGRLRDALGPEFLLVPVTYLDYECETIPKLHSIQPYFFKRSSYAWEREIRAVADMEMGKRIGTPRSVPIDIGVLVQKVIVSPLAAPDYAEKVRSLMKLGSLSVPIHLSAINLSTSAVDPGA